MRRSADPRAGPSCTMSRKMQPRPPRGCGPGGAGPTFQHALSPFPLPGRMTPHDPAAPAPRRRLALALAAGVALLAALVYANALKNGVAIDDEYIVMKNPAVRGFSHLHDLLLGPYWPQSTELYRPGFTPLTAYGFERYIPTATYLTFH